MALALLSQQWQRATKSRRSIHRSRIYVPHNKRCVLLVRYVRCLDRRPDSIDTFLALQRRGAQSSARNASFLPFHIKRKCSLPRCIFGCCCCCCWRCCTSCRCEGSERAGFRSAGIRRSGLFGATSSEDFSPRNFRLRRPSESIACFDFLTIAAFVVIIFVRYFFFAVGP